MADATIGADASRRLAAWFHRLLIGGAIVGILLPALAIVFKAHPDPDAWRSVLKDQTTYPEELVYRGLQWPFAAAPALRKSSWLNPHTRLRDVSYYVGYVRFNVVCLILAIGYRRRLQGWLLRAANWVRRADNAYARRLIVAAAALAIFSFQTKAHWGFFWPGISGWTEKHSRSRLTSELPEDPAKSNPAVAGVDPGDAATIDPRDAPWLDAALLPGNARYLRSPGYLTGQAMFLHFDDGTVLPGNRELAEVTFVNYAFGDLRYTALHPDVFAAVVKSSLDNRRRNRRFLLPLSVSYPNHAPYVPIDYRDYPASSALRSITFWTLTVHADPHEEEGRVRVVRATRELSIDAR